ncbi:acetate kinase [Buchnera aphidicola]|uniref:Acetate kinase n=1 Tax=Buchnera aphidicola (Stegophylla sp.) TaxID=2315800 RepID=A0A4D6YKZ1_9GAMM|nr:acetate kinase [Buchnera aphidicola (Stegophylla sp.)]QCI26308.1 acetate kinase [Buchnera aphidicola (Stegophylla sp.)]
MLNDLVLVLNFGSSSLKFAILNPDTERKYVFGLVERLYLSYSFVTWYYQRFKYHTIIGNNISHIQSLEFIINHIFYINKKIVCNIQFIGHRVVHGGKKITESKIINSCIIQEIENNIIYAPLHNPINLLGIKSAIKYFPHLSKKNVAVFDTSFFRDMPETSYLYALPYSFYIKYGVRRYGAHGMSHYYVSKIASEILKIQFDTFNVITCHLGNGSSVSVIVNGICVDTSMGFTPMEGLVMGTRSGDLDPAIIFFMHMVLGMTIDEIQHILIKKSGILGLSGGVTSDFRYIEKNYYREIASKRSVDIFCHRLSKYIASYTTLLDGRLDAIIFTGGIGENSILVRQLTMIKLFMIGIRLDMQLNQCLQPGQYGFINKKDTTPVLVIPTNEELIIAQETVKCFR